MSEPRNWWDHYPTDEELASLVIDPAKQQDNLGNSYTPISWPTGRRQPMICSCCEQDFADGGWFNYAPQGRESFRIIVCPEHEVAMSMMEVEDEIAAAL